MRLTAGGARWVLTIRVAACFVYLLRFTKNGHYLEQDARVSVKASTLTATLDIESRYVPSNQPRQAGKWM